MITLMRKSGQPIAVDPFEIVVVEPWEMDGDYSDIKVSNGDKHTINKPFNDLVNVINVAKNLS